MNNLFCIECGEENNVKILTEKRTVNVRNLPIEAAFTYRKCFDCNAEWGSSEDPDGLDEAYRIYRVQENMMQPEEIKFYRNKYDLTQRELAKLMGFGEVTIARYENGALQDKAHDNLLQMLKTPAALISLLTRNSKILSREKYDRLIIKLIKERDIENNKRKIHSVYALAPNLLNGFLEFSYEKVKQVALFFCENGVGRVALCKLFFYSDFYNYKLHNTGITGLQFAYYKFGPVPYKYEDIYETLVMEDLLSCEEIEQYFYDENGKPAKEYNYKSRVVADLKEFTEEEIEVLNYVKENLGKKSGKALTDQSHEEDAYIQKPWGNISYEHAKTLKDF